ncbi:MAG: FG-GAP repeat protein [Deltaproteobacteria bacterium]|nr:FG-GAP repeat protein [Deltaproteobacteria bacterium]
MAALSRKPLCFFALLFLVSALGSQGYAAELTVFGPKTYVRTTGAPNIYTDPFSAIPGQGNLIVKNGQIDGYNRVTYAIDSAKILLNGEQIFGPSDFNEHVYSLEAPITLAGDNALRVELRSDPNSYLTIEVTQEVPSPTVTISAAPGTITVGESSILTWSSTNADTCTIEPDIGPVDPSGSTTVSPTETTIYTITATGPGGTATASASITVIYPPSITIVEPDGIDDRATIAYTVQWTDADPDDDAVISLYYDVDNSGQDGTLIVSGLSEDPDGAEDDEYVWDTTEVPDGSYYVYGVIDDGVNDPVVDYSDGVVTIHHAPPSFPEFKITASDGEEYDYFGDSLSISGEEVIVGAPYDDDKGYNSGAAYIFKRNVSGWAEQVKLLPSSVRPPPHIEIEVNLGLEVILAYDPEYESGDMAPMDFSYDTDFDRFRLFKPFSNDIIVTGIEFYDGDNWLDRTSDTYWYPTSNMTYRSGEGWMWDKELGELRVKGDWAEGFRPTLIRITFEEIEPVEGGGGEGGGDPYYFGYSVSIDGIYAIVGAPYDDYREKSSGAAYVFKHEGDTWVEEVKLKAGDAEGYDYFGDCVSISGDYAIVGAYGDDDGGSYSGAAYIFRREGSTWVEEVKLKAGDAEGYDYFGDCVSISGDYAIAGAPYDDDRGYNSGAAYIFRREGDTWIEEAKLTADDSAAFDNFGYSVAISGDYAIVGAYGNSEYGSYSGAAYIFKREESNWIEQAKITAGDPAASSYFGYSVAIRDDFAIVGAYGNSEGGSYSGAAYIFRREGSTWVEEVKLKAGDAEEYDYFGDCVSISGDSAIAGAPYEDSNENSSGAAYIYSIRTVEISADPETIQPGESSILTWSSTNADTCVIEPDIGSVDLTGSITVSPTETTTYTITATGPFGITTASATAFVGYLPPTISIGADPETIGIGESSILTWSSTHADTCEIDQGIGPVDLIGSISVSPTETTTYTITATGPGGITTASATVSVGYLPPAVSIGADPTAIQEGGSSTLSWSSTHADTCEIEPDVGIVEVSGSISVSPTETTTYTITATGPGGTAIASVRVIVTSTQPAVFLGARPETIYIGQGSNLIWSSTHADTCVIEPGIGEVDINGSTYVYPTETTTYTITATGPGGTATNSVTITAIHPQPTVSISASPETIELGESSTLTWSSYHADTCEIDQGIGPVDQIGSVSVSPTETTTYTITATGPGGTATDSVTVTVTYPQPIVTIIADPETIHIGESSILTWSSTYADTCVIEPDIGIVDVDGSITISPTETTIYTITATGPGGTATDSVTVTVTSPPPTISISADPENIQVGESSTLSWNSTHADTCEIDQGIGTVDLVGSIIVLPTDTTTYTITATGPGGTATGSVAVTVLNPPTVSISADPETMNIGESSTLTWSSQYADSCTIEPDIGSVDLTGSITVSPTETTTYIITASNPVETATASITVTVIPLNISIISPLDGETIYKPDIMVQGTITNPLATEVGITVNGIVAMVEGNQFMANHIPLEQGENTLTVTAMDWEGNMAIASITVYAETEGEYIMITADDESGTSPLETTLRIEGSFTFTDPYLTYTGPGMVEFLGIPEEHEYEIQITGEGVYYFTAEVTDTENNTYTDTIAIVVLNQAQLDALLKAKWEGMKTALVAGDIEKALSYHHEAFKDRYESIYNLLASNLPILAQQMQGIEMIFAEGNRGKYGINRDHDIDGQIVTITYYIYFSKDENGLWKIERY